ncbi:DUF1836 domain-containing protein [Dysosmobacter sp. HCP28S3_G4]|uniref:DUF1836 domain-containing protein n=1 Tax=Dysosmobacter sp. HCP28S3_G4 TaxID=3438938 RepID=UPI003F8AFA91
MDELMEIQERMRSQRPVNWEQLPDFPLYMDQVLSYMDRQILRFEEDDGLTSAMVNNYTKSGLLPRAEGKKYNRTHLAYLTAICVLKRVMSAKDMEMVLSAQLEQRQNVGEGYDQFRDSLGKALNLITEMMEAYNQPEDIADAAIHFALLAYAAEVASSRYVALLRRQRQPEEPKKPQKVSRKERRKQEKEAAEDA